MSEERAFWITLGFLFFGWFVLLGVVRWLFQPA